MDALQHNDQNLLHFSKKRLSRRDFLKGLVAAVGGFSCLSPVSGKVLGAALQSSPSSLLVRASLSDGNMDPLLLNPPTHRPGSVMKLIATAALCEERLISPEAVLECRGEVVLNGKSYRCQTPHGQVSLVNALGMSCNVYFTQAVRSLGSRVFLEHARRFGLAEGVSLTPSGAFPQQSSLEVFPYVFGLAEDLQPTPYQLLRIVGLIANRGIVPGCLSFGSWRGEGVDRVQCAPATWSVLQQGMRLAARQGTGKNLDPKDTLHAALKTGTVPHGYTFESLVVGYYPVEKPQTLFYLYTPSGASQDSAIPLLKQALGV